MKALDWGALVAGLIFLYLAVRDYPREEGGGYALAAVFLLAGEAWRWRQRDARAEGRGRP